MRFALYSGVVAALLTTSLAACGEESDDPSAPSCDAATTVTYDGQAKAVFDANCIFCHSPTAADRNGAPAGVNFNSYSNAVASAALARSRVSAATMPPDFAPAFPDDAQRCIIINWVDQGTPEN